MKPLSFCTLQASLIGLGHSLQKAPWWMNLIGIRSGGDDNAFNDTLVAAWYQDSRPNLVSMNATTDPGLHWRRHPIVARGTAILKPGRYVDMWRLGLHRGQYEALVQRGECVVYRDNDRDARLDTEGVGEETGLFGINCHRAAESYQPSTVDRWSAGCQVIPDSADFGLLLALCRKHARRHGNRFTYTLIEESDLWNR